MTQRPVNYGKYASFTRGDLIRTIEHLLERETKMLNSVADLTSRALENKATEAKLPWAKDGEA
jgi:hypothetical protein